MEVMVQDNGEPGHEFGHRVTKRIREIQDEDPLNFCDLKFTTSSDGIQTCNLVWSVTESNATSISQEEFDQILGLIHDLWLGKGRFDWTNYLQTSNKMQVIRNIKSRMK